MSKKLLHAKHNESVCNFISHKQDFADWVVITAFYSAMHFVDHKIFPLAMKTDDGKKFRLKTVDEYKLFVESKKDKHSVRVELVNKACNTVRSEFFWLYNTCKTARYLNYQFSQPRQIAVLAKDHLAAIRKYCE